MMRMKTIGSQAYNTLKNEGKGFISGVTSTGVFIKTTVNKILFLTTQPYKGPLTINLGGDTYALEGIENEMQVSMGEEELSIPDIDLRIQATPSERWCAPLPEAQIRSARERVETLKAFTAEILTIIGEDDFPEGVLWLGALVRGDENRPSKPGSILNTLLHLQELTREGEFSKVREICHKLLGWGEGLTPAGDDLLLGWLLGLNRWKHILLPEIDLQSLNEDIVAAAYQKTTTVSANLIECAARGEGDERLLAVVDAMLCEVREQDNLIEELLSWGSSSGTYAFCGMGTAVGSISEKG